MYHTTGCLSLMLNRFHSHISADGGGGGQAAKDALGNDVTAVGWLQTHPKGDHSLTQGLKVRRGYSDDHSV